MKITFADLWRPSGTIDRASYALVGVVGFALKHNLDRLVARYGFNRPWGLFNYWVPVRDVLRVTQLPRQEAVFLATMVALSLPFVWVGVALTLKRLRSAKLPLALVVLFFVPFLNLLFFLLLSLIPDRDSNAASRRSARQASFLTQIVPQGALGSAAVSLLLTVPVGLGMVLLGTRVLLNYGWGLFVAIPFTMGFGAALVYGIRRPRSFGGCVGVACLSASILGAALMALAFEGLGCLIMAMPLALPLAAFGGGCGYLVQRRSFPSEAPVFLSALLLLAPSVQWAEHAVAPHPPVYEVQTTIDVHASPEIVWTRWSRSPRFRRPPSGSFAPASPIRSALK
jgi:hypothetical protein